MDLQNFMLAGIAFIGVFTLINYFKRPGGKSKDELFDLQNQLTVAKESASRNAALAEEREKNLLQVKKQLRDEVEEKERLIDEVSQMKTRLEDEIEVHKTMEEKFGDIAREALKEQGEEFSKTNMEKMNTALQRYTDNFDRLRQDLGRVNDDASKERQELKHQLENISKDSQELAKALKSDSKAQGVWGELVLQRILESCGLREGIEYEKQVHRTGDEGQRFLPDVVIKLSEDKTLVVDSKVSLTAYLEATRATTEEDRQKAIDRHIISVKKHIDELSEKGYQSLEKHTVDYVVLFLPYESALAATMNDKTDITSYAYDKNIMIATPTTLLMALRTVSHIWNTERRNKNAEQIADQAGKLFDKVSVFVKTFEKAEKGLEDARKAFETGRIQLDKGSGNVLGRIVRLKELGAKTTKTITREHDPVEGIEGKIEQ